MSDSAKQVGLSPLDRAYGLRLAGDTEEGLRLAASIATASPNDLGAVLLLARVLVDLDRVAVAGPALARLATDLGLRADLPAATVAAQWAAEAGGYGDGALQALAQAFGKGSARVAEDAGVPPPPLPEEVEVAPFFAKATGDPLLEQAERVLSRYLESAPPKEQPLPELPLFGELAPPELARLLGCLEPRVLDSGAHVITQGEEGREAFVLVRGLANVVRDDGRGGHQMLSALGPGAIFGEMALVSAAPRAASVIAVEPVVLLVAGRDRLEALARETPVLGNELGGFCHRRMISNLIRHSEILSGVAAERRADLMGRFQARQLPAGTRLVNQGQEPSSLYLLASGEVQVRSTDAEGERVVLAHLGPGDVVGEISLVLRRPANADVVVRTPTVALELTRERFQEAIREHPELLRELYDIATQREEETRSVVALEALDVDETVLL
jgi:CRP-like cAMP-binding protein